ncbi:hypothetical protein DL95DRAFT_430593 [Leptodontidium sp. 2 PMI_412]|nr:hypothetical protein DL95DRAFT_430593 [Leptodontidium sp. 2 PMI_412]
MIGGINNAKDYIELIGFGRVKAINGPPNTPAIATNLLQGGIVSVYYLGKLFGALVGGWGVFGASLQCSAQSHVWMILVSGVFFINDGASPIRWRFPIAFQIIRLLILLSVVWWFLESPRWLVKVEQEDEGRYILGRLRDICNVSQLEKQTGNRTSYWGMFTGQRSGGLHTDRRVQLVIWLQIMQEWVGIAGVTVYALTIFRMAGFDTGKSQWISGLNNIFYMFSTLVCIFTLDRIGRRWTLYWGSVCQGIAMFLAGGIMSRPAENATNAGNTTKASQYGAAAASMIFIFTFVFGATWLTGNAWGVVGWVMFNAIDEKTLYTFAMSNVITIPMEMDSLFASKILWVWGRGEEFC